MSRRWLWLVGAIALALTFAQSPGQISPDTKLDLTANPLRFLARATNLWNSELPFGQAQNQAYGYLFPHGTFFLPATLLGLPGWVTQRLWWALLLTVGFWGLLRVAEALRHRQPGVTGDRRGRVRAVAAGADHARVDLVGDAADDAGAVGAAADDPGAARRLGAVGAGAGRPRSALAVALMGAVNAIATLAGCLPAVIWWACHRPNRLWWRFTAWWLLALLLAMLWWVVALVLLRPDQPAVPGLHRILRRHDAVDVADRDAARHRQLDAVRRAQRHRGRPAGHRVGRGAGDDAGRGGRAGRAGDARPMPARGRLVTMLLVGVVLLAVGYSRRAGIAGGARRCRRSWTPAGAPLRNVHKLEPVIRIPLVLGLAHLLGRIPLPGSAPRPVWLRAFAHPERDKRVAVGDRRADRAGGRARRWRGPAG